jgi:c-di-GMP-binding flagellar brake protein YcgR
MRFLDKLFKKEPQHVSSPKIVPALAETVGLTTDTQSNKARCAPLIELQNNRQLLEVKTGTGNQFYQTMILVVDVDRGLIWLDDFFPQPQKLSIGDEISVRHHKNGEHLVLHSPIVAFGESYGASGVAILLPEEIIYTPRRSSPRFTVGQESSLNVKLRTLGQEPFFGRLQDVSLGGMRVLVPGNLLGHLSHGAILPLCEISIDANITLRCRARVCSFRTSRTPYRHTQIGVEFTELNDQNRALLQQLIQKMNHHHQTFVAA